MYAEKITETYSTYTACIEKCITSFHTPLDWSSASFFKVMETNSSSCLVGDSIILFFLGFKLVDIMLLVSIQIFVDYSNLY